MAGISLPHMVSKTYKINFHFERRLTQHQRDTPAVYRGKIVVESASNLVKSKQEDVVIRMYDKSNESKKNYGASSRDLLLLQRPVHENFVRFVHSIEDNDFVYIATEYCQWSVAHLLLNDIDELQAIKNDLGALDILRQSTEGLAFLHDFGYFHRNLSPSKFRIATYGKIHMVKLCDFRQAMKTGVEKENPIAREDIWIAPELADKDHTIDASVDSFVFGLYFYFVLFGGAHPFQDGGSDKQTAEEICNSENECYEWASEPIGTELEMALVASYQTCWSNSKGFNQENSEAIVRSGFKLIRELIMFDPTKRKSVIGVRDNFLMKPGAQPSYDLYNRDGGRKPGLCLVFCQSIFKNNNNLPAHEKTRNVLETTFQQLGFVVKTHNNKNFEVIKKELKKVAKYEAQNYNSLVVAFLSHGGNGYINDSDGDYATIFELQMLFNSRVCPDMHGKPKIFIVGACRQTNPRRQMSTKRADDGGDSLQAKTPDINEKNLSPVSDFCLITTTYENAPSYSDPQNGSAYLTLLCRKLVSWEADDIIFENVLTRVQDEMTRNPIEIAKNVYDIVTPQRTSSCSKQIVFKKKGKKKTTN